MMATVDDSPSPNNTLGTHAVMYEKVIRIGRPDSDWRVYVDGRPTFSTAATLGEAMAIGRRALDATKLSEPS